jgi:hypothetical protein
MADGSYTGSDVVLVGFMSNIPDSQWNEMVRQVQQAGVTESEARELMNTLVMPIIFTESAQIGTIINVASVILMAVAVVMVVVAIILARSRNNTGQYTVYQDTPKRYSYPSESGYRPPNGVYGQGTVQGGSGNRDGNGYRPPNGIYGQGAVQSGGQYINPEQSAEPFDPGAIKQPNYDAFFAPKGKSNAPQMQSPVMVSKESVTPPPVAPVQSDTITPPVITDTMLSLEPPTLSAPPAADYMEDIPLELPSEEMLRDALGDTPLDMDLSEYMEADFLSPESHENEH